MADRYRFLPAGTGALLVELDDLEATLTLHDALQADWPDGVIELVPAARTLLMRFDPLATERFALVVATANVDLSNRSIRHGETFEIPVTYDGAVTTMWLHSSGGRSNSLSVGIPRRPTLLPVPVLRRALLT
ncbi:carboxyltransferase domain-containing protein [Mesorhizobium abyssinicae]|uniref:carboxyltransferase domain-containing protein n=1 Tax=Mesorhizobium abyssinicae TaxID=1209958 RepID=UPI003393838F